MNTNIQQGINEVQHNQSYNNQNVNNGMNNYNNVRVQKLDAQGGTQNISLANEQDEGNLKFRRIPVYEKDSDSDSQDGGSYIDDNEFSDDKDNDNSDDNSDDSSEETSSYSDDDDNVELIAKGGGDLQEGGKKMKSVDTESISSVSTTEVLSKDPLFLVLSEFLMDDETGSNLVHVGNDIVQMLGKINLKLGRIADCLEKRTKKEKKNKKVDE